MGSIDSTPQNPSIPLIDFTPFLSSNPDPSTRLPTARAILSAFKTYGFLYLTHHGIAPSTLQSAFSQSSKFFTRPYAEKEALAWTTPDSNRGYSAPGREKVSQASTREEVEEVRKQNPDLKETFEIGREGEPQCPNRWPAKELVAAGLRTENEWDVEGEEFETVMKNFFTELKETHRLVMSAIALGMGFQESFFDPYVERGDNTLRLLHYPPVRKSVFEANKGQVRAGEHTDYGSITLLFQDARGGLQVRDPEGGNRWVDVEPIEGACVVNAGDLLARWSNDLIRSTEHRVVEPPARIRVSSPSSNDGDAGVNGNGTRNGESGVKGEDVREYPARYSIAYFCNPDFDKFIDVLPGTWEGEKGGKKYEGVNSGQYLVQRLSATY
ncbi:hypothetical protein MMC25_002657 [Agyrium rufum]|nr:hypothetical protein [Agyrium rufum]